MAAPVTALRPTMLKLGEAPIAPSPFWLLVMVYAPGPGIVSHSYGRLPFGGGMAQLSSTAELRMAKQTPDGSCAEQMMGG